MRNFLYLLTFIVVSSCASTAYYQVYSTETKLGEETTGGVIFKDENVSISYNLWAEGGNIGFTILNQSDSNIYVNL